MNQRIAPEQPAPSLRSALWTERRLLLYVEQNGRTRTVSVKTPYARIGSDPRCEVQVDAPSVPRVAYYVHATRNGIFAVGFTGTADQPPVPSWLEPDQALRVGELQIYAEFADPSADTPPDAPPLLDTRGSVPDPAPILSVRTGGQHHATTRLQRRLTTIGRAKPCALRLKNGQISLPHCVLYWQDGRVWVIDLLSRNGTVIDAVRRDVAELALGVPVRLGDIELILSAAPAQRDLNRQQLAADRAAVSTERAALETLRAQLDCERTELNQLRVELERSKTKADAISAERSDQHRELEQLRSELEQNQTALATVREDVDRERQELTQIRSALELDQAKLATENAALAVQQHDLNQLRQQLDQAQEALATAREELDHDRQDLANQQHELEQSKAEHQQQQAALEDERKQLEAAQKPAPRPLLPTRNTAPPPANRVAPETHPVEKPRKRSFFW